MGDDLFYDLELQMRNKAELKTVYGDSGKYEKLLEELVESGKSLNQKRSYDREYTLSSGDEVKYTMTLAPMMLAFFCKRYDVVVWLVNMGYKVFSDIRVIIKYQMFDHNSPDVGMDHECQKGNFRYDIHLVGQYLEYADKEERKIIDQVMRTEFEESSAKKKKEIGWLFRLALLDEKTDCFKQMQEKFPEIYHMVMELQNEHSGLDYIPCEFRYHWFTYYKDDCQMEERILKEIRNARICHAAGYSEFIGEVSPDSIERQQSLKREIEFLISYCRGNPQRMSALTVGLIKAWRTLGNLMDRGVIGEHLGEFSHETIKESVQYCYMSGVDVNEACHSCEFMYTREHLDILESIGDMMGRKVSYSMPELKRGFFSDSNNMFTAPEDPESTEMMMELWDIIDIYIPLRHHLYQYQKYIMDMDREEVMMKALKKNLIPKEVYKKLMQYARQEKKYKCLPLLIQKMNGL